MYVSYRLTLSGTVQSRLWKLPLAFYLMPYLFPFIHQFRSSGIAKAGLKLLESQKSNTGEALEARLCLTYIDYKNWTPGFGWRRRRLHNSCNGWPRSAHPKSPKSDPVILPDFCGFPLLPQLLTGMECVSKRPIGLKVIDRKWKIPACFYASPLSSYIHEKSCHLPGKQSVVWTFCGWTICCLDILCWT